MTELETILGSMALATTATFALTNLASFIAIKLASYETNISPKKVPKIYFEEMHKGFENNLFDKFTYNLVNAIIYPGMKLASYEICPNWRNTNVSRD